MRRALGIIFIAAFVAAAMPAQAMKPPKRPPPPPPQTVPEGETLARIKPPPSYTAKRIALFPFELPGYVLKGVLWPIGAATDWLQREHYADRVANILSFKSQRIWIYPVIDKSPGSSFGGGVAFKGTDLWKQGYNIDAVLRAHVNGDVFGDVRFLQNDLFRVGGVPVALSFNGSWYWQPSFPYYGVGNDALQGNQSSWNEQDLEGTARLGLKPIKPLAVYVLLGGAATMTGDGSTDGINPAANPPLGYGRWLPYLRMGGGVGFDTRDVEWDPHRGGLYKLELSRYQYFGSGGSFSYNDADILLSQYIPLWSPRHTLMLRTGWHLQGNGSGIPVPRMAVLDANHWLRGFSRNRFRDNASGVINAEYYFPLFSRVRGMVLFDYGRVFDSISDITFSDFKYSAGGGFDIEATKVIIIRFRAAYGGEGVKFLFTLLRKQP